MTNHLVPSSSELVDIPIYHGSEPQGQPIGVLKIRRDAIPGGLAWDLQPTFRLVSPMVWEVTRLSLNLRAIKPMQPATPVPSVKIVKESLPVVEGEISPA